MYVKTVLVYLKPEPLDESNFSEFIMPKVPLHTLNNGQLMPKVGLGTWQVSFLSLLNQLSYISHFCSIVHNKNYKPSIEIISGAVLILFSFY